jgi:hypothetical protein
MAGMTGGKRTPCVFGSAKMNALFIFLTELLLARAEQTGRQAC